MIHFLCAQELNTSLALNTFTFKTTASLISSNLNHGWIAQSEAKKAAYFGLNIHQEGFNVLVLGAQGTGRTSLTLSAMNEIAHKSTKQMFDLVGVYHFEALNQPTLLKLKVGNGAMLRDCMEAFIRDYIAELPKWFIGEPALINFEMADIWFKEFISKCGALFLDEQEKLHTFFNLVAIEMMEYLKAWQPAPIVDGESLIDGLINETFLARFKINLLVDNRSFLDKKLNQSIIYDNDPTLPSLFGSVEPSTENAGLPDFLRLRAGNIHRADGGMIMIHLRDLLNDEQSGAQIIEKLHRFLRNGTLQIEDISTGAQSNTTLANNTLLKLDVKLVVIASREDFYDCLDTQPDFFDYFPIKVEFAERIVANQANFEAIAGFVAKKCEHFNCPHFSAEAVSKLVWALQRLEEDQTRISTNFAMLEKLMLESVAFADKSAVVNVEHVNAAINAKSHRNQYFESQIRDSIIDNELLIQVRDSVVGQVNGLTHIELGDASFGSPIRITARCYPGKTGLINIDREVNMSGPNHDKGIYILQNWLSASFWQLAPLSLNASLVFEQEYNGVEGDSASCAELFALLSALAGLPIKQGIAVTGALNQFGEVMPIGGVNEKIEGYFRVCKALGLDGKQGVIIPKRNQRHLMLDSEVVAAVESGHFHIIAIDHVLEGIAYLTEVVSGEMDADGGYIKSSVMGQAQETLASYRKTLEKNQMYFITPNN
jgi:predicted ATP-dependent protease